MKIRLHFAAVCLCGPYIIPEMLLFSDALYIFFITCLSTQLISEKNKINYDIYYSLNRNSTLASNFVLLSRFKTDTNSTQWVHESNASLTVNAVEIC